MTTTTGPVISPVFQGLSKPAVIMGVDYDYFFIAGLIVMLAFIYSGNLLSFALLIPLHFAGWILCQIDPHIFKLISARASIGVVRHYRLWSCQSYEAC